MLRVHFVVPDIRSEPEQFNNERLTLRHTDLFTVTIRYRVDKCFGGHSERETPGHIPNPEAKPLSADGTARVTVWESRTPPDLL